MKIAFVIHKLADRSGGAERVLIETANEMATRGHNVCIWSHENRGVPPFYALKGVSHKNLFDRPIHHEDKARWKRREHRMEKLSLNFPWRHLKWRMANSMFIQAVRQEIERFEPDVLVPFLPPAMTVCTIAVKKSRKVPIVASTHNSPTQDYENLDRWDPNPIDIKHRIQAIEHVSKMLVLLPEYGSWYSSHHQTKIVTMPNPVTPVSDELRNNALKEKVILAVGRLADVKRFDILVDAWARIHSEFPEWRVEIYGDGPLREELLTRSRMAGTIASLTFKGTVHNVSDQYLKSAVMFHPAEFEGFPLAVCEALAHGLPVVGYDDCSGLNTLVRHGENGILMESGEDRIGAAVSTLRGLLSDQKMLNKLARNGPGSVAQYSPTIVYDKWEQVLREAGKH